jgi:hypothetical protein
MGLPADLAFRTKGQLAIEILAEALAAGVRLDLVCGDEVYGACTELRGYLEDHDHAYVLRVQQIWRLRGGRAGGVKLSQGRHCGNASYRGTSFLPQKQSAALILAVANLGEHPR